MRSSNLWNTTMLLGAVAAGFGLSASVSSPTAERGNSLTVTDAAGVEVPVRNYRRIASTSTIADQVLVRIVEPTRLLAVSGHTIRTQSSPVYADKTGVEHARDIETLIELRPDIVFINNFVDRKQVARLKDAGLNVFDLGAMRGLETLPANIRAIARVMGVPHRGDVLANELVRELEAVSADIPASARRLGLYVGIHGDRLYGGAAETSFHDVIEAGGLVDMAARAGYSGWPAYTSEQLLELDPPWIITNPGTEDALCRHPGLERLAACRLGQVRSVDTDLLTDPGLGMVDAARAVRLAVYGPKPPEQTTRKGLP